MGEFIIKFPCKSVHEKEQSGNNQRLEKREAERAKKLKKRKKSVYKSRMVKMREPVTKLQWRTNQKMIESDGKKRKKEEEERERYRVERG